MATRPIRVALVNDHPLVVHGLLGLLAPHAGRVEIVELDSGLDVAQRVDVALFDTFAMDGPEQPALDRLLADPGIGRVAVYSWNTTPDQVERLLELGISGLISKTATGRELADALVAVHAGEMVVPRTVNITGNGTGGADGIPGSKHAAPGSEDWPGRAQGLTGREGEIVTLITMGYSNLEIAERTYLSINSVKSYIRTAYRTMGVTNRSQAILWGLDHDMRPRTERVTGPAAV